MVFCTGVLHADLHPGNALVRPTSTRAPQVVLLDVGHAYELAEAERKTLRAVWRAHVSVHVTLPSLRCPVLVSLRSPLERRRDALGRAGGGRVRGD
jgi:hypothetical protein